MSQPQPRQSGIDALILTASEYCHILDQNSGLIRLVEGPYRGSLTSNEALYDTIQEKIIVKEGQYAIILNPFNLDMQNIQRGDREIRVGPCFFSLYPGEVLENREIQQEFVLTEHNGLLVQATREFIEGGKEHKSGDIWLIQGPARFIPHKYAKVIQQVETISLGINEGIYIKNIRTGVVRLEKGPKSFLLSPDECPFQKIYTFDEIRALKLDHSTFDFTQAFPLILGEAEAALVVKNEKQVVVVGPQTVLLEPFEHLRILQISGKTPKIPNQHCLWKVFIGPVFMSDELLIRTKDNAELSVLVRYKTKFSVDPEHLEKVFAVEDFIGYATETMASIIRQESAQYNFEDFHSKAGEIIQHRVFQGSSKSYIFEENGFEIFGIDIKKIVPQDPQIANQLNAAIKSNMEIYVSKIQQSAQLEAERQLIEGKIEIEKTRQKLIALEQENLQKQQIGNARIEAEAIIERAKGQTEANRLEVQTSNMLAAAKMQETLSLLQSPTAECYLRLQQIASFSNVEKSIIVPTDSKIWLPFPNPDLKEN